VKTEKTETVVASTVEFAKIVNDIVHPVSEVPGANTRRMEKLEMKAKLTQKDPLPK
jgi:hypothetical protein